MADTNKLKVCKDDNEECKQKIIEDGGEEERRREEREEARSRGETEITKQ